MKKEAFSFDESMFLNVDVLETISEIASDLFEIEESAIFELGVLPVKNPDQMLSEFHMPVISELLAFSEV
jgi:hypothetical protein